MYRLDGAVDRVKEVGADRVDLDGVAQSTRERGDGRLSVVTGAVEAPVDKTLGTNA